MTIKFFVFILFTTSFLLKAEESSVKAIYGKDNRVKANLYKNDYFKSMSKSVAAFIDNDNIEMLYFDQLAKITGVNFGDKYEVCSSERFQKNLSVSHCSGFLVAPDILMTAGHCILDLYDCSQSKWVFDYDFDRVQVEGHFHTLGSNIYSCVEVIDRKYTFTNEDYAIVRLDRKVKDRLPLKIRTKEKIKKNTNLVLIGHPRGLPKVITNGGKVTQNVDEKFFSSNLDAFQGNSGGPVFNAGTGLVEGILIRGGDDFFYDLDKDCYTSFICDLHGDCPGEDVMRINEIPKLLEILKK